MDAIFTTLNATFTAQDATREALRTRREVTDAHIRVAQRALAQLHVEADLGASTAAIRTALKEIGPLVLAIEQALPDEPGAFYRYYDLWRNLLQTCSMAAVVAVFVDYDRLAGVEDVKEIVGGAVRLPVEDYLVGVCNAMPELARLSMNCVIRNDYVTPGRCARFAHDVSEGFKQLNLRNDFLRKRYDGIKYDVKRMEEIMYDLSIRGLGKKGADAKMDVAMGKVAQVKLEDAHVTKTEEVKKEDTVMAKTEDANMVKTE